MESRFNAPLVVPVPLFEQSIGLIRLREEARRWGFISGSPQDGDISLEAAAARIAHEELRLRMPEAGTMLASRILREKQEGVIWLQAAISITVTTRDGASEPQPGNAFRWFKLVQIERMEAQGELKPHVLDIVRKIYAQKILG